MTRKRMRSKEPRHRKMWKRDTDEKKKWEKKALSKRKKEKKKKEEKKRNDKSSSGEKKALIKIIMLIPVLKCIGRMLRPQLCLCRMGWVRGEGRESNKATNMYEIGHNYMHMHDCTRMEMANDYKQCAILIVLWHNEKALSQGKGKKPAN